MHGCKDGQPTRQGNKMDYISLIESSRAWYDHNWGDRHYHNWGHALSVVDNVHKITDTPSDELIIAAYWHDAVYVPGAGTDANERCSAAALVQSGRIYKDIGSQNVIQLAAQMIRYTKIDNHLHEGRLTGDIAILLDADLGSLAAPYELFLYTQENIILENGGTMEENKDQSAAFLKQFLKCREFIYHTDYARLNWEQAARSNIERYCKE